MPVVGSEKSKTAADMIEKVACSEEEANLTNGIYKNASFMHSVCPLMGSPVHVHLLDGRELHGILMSFSSDCDIALGVAHEVSGRGIDDETKFFPPVDAIVDKIIIRRQDIVLVTATTDLETVTKASFATDADISKFNGEAKGKVLEAWEPDHDHDEHLLDAADDVKGGWSPEEMFQKNREFGLGNSTYHMDLYSTCRPEFDDPAEMARKSALAEKVAREIESNPASKRAAQLENEDEEQDLGAPMSRDSGTYVSGSADVASSASKILQKRKADRGGSTTSGFYGKGSVSNRGSAAPPIATSREFRAPAQSSRSFQAPPPKQSDSAGNAGIGQAAVFENDHPVFAPAQRVSPRQPSNNLLREKSQTPHVSASKLQTADSDWSMRMGSIRSDRSTFSADNPDCTKPPPNHFVGDVAQPQPVLARKNAASVKGTKEGLKDFHSKFALSSPGSSNSGAFSAVAGGSNFSSGHSSTTVSVQLPPAASLTQSQGSFTGDGASAQHPKIPPTTVRLHLPAVAPNSSGSQATPPAFTVPAGVVGAARANVSVPPPPTPPRPPPPPPQGVVPRFRLPTSAMPPPTSSQPSGSFAAGSAVAGSFQRQMAQRTPEVPNPAQQPFTLPHQPPAKASFHANSSLSAPPTTVALDRPDDFPAPQSFLSVGAVQESQGHPRLTPSTSQSESGKTSADVEQVAESIKKSKLNPDAKEFTPSAQTFARGVQALPAQSLMQMSSSQSIAAIASSGIAYPPPTPSPLVSLAGPQLASPYSAPQASLNNPPLQFYASPVGATMILSGQGHPLMTQASFPGSGQGATLLAHAQQQPCGVQVNSSSAHNVVSVVQPSQQPLQGSLQMHASASNLSSVPNNVATNLCSSNSNSSNPNFNNSGSPASKFKKTMASGQTVASATGPPLMAQQYQGQPQYLIQYPAAAQTHALQPNQYVIPRTIGPAPHFIVPQPGALNSTEPGQHLFAISSQFVPANSSVTGSHHSVAHNVVGLPMLNSGIAGSNSAPLRPTHTPPNAQQNPNQAAILAAAPHHQYHQLNANSGIVMIPQYMTTTGGPVAQLYHQNMAPPGMPTNYASSLAGPGGEFVQITPVQNVLMSGTDLVGNHPQFMMRPMSFVSGPQGGGGGLGH